MQLSIRLYRTMQTFKYSFVVVFLIPCFYLFFYNCKPSFTRLEYSGTKLNFRNKNPESVGTVDNIIKTPTNYTKKNITYYHKSVSLREQELRLYESNNTMVNPNLPICEILLHYHIGETGGSAIRNWFERNESWKRTIIAKNMNKENFYREFAVEKSGLQYIEVHCTNVMTLRQVVEFGQMIRSTKSDQCTFETFVVVREPKDKLCSTQKQAQHRKKIDYDNYLKHKWRNHMVEVSKYGIRSCSREQNLIVTQLDAENTLRDLLFFDVIIDLSDLSIWFEKRFKVPIYANCTNCIQSQKKIACHLPIWNENVSKYDRWLYSQVVKSDKFYTHFVSNLTRNFYS